MEYRNNHILLALTGILTITLAIVLSTKFFPKSPPAKAESKPTEYESVTNPKASKKTSDFEGKRDKILGNVAEPEFDERQAIAVTEKAVCRTNVARVNEMTEKWWIEHDGQYPKDDLSDMGRDEDYFPNGIPRCPVDGTMYRLDPHTHRIAGHQHSNIKEWELFDKIIDSEKKRKNRNNSKRAE